MTKIVQPERHEYHVAYARKNRTRLQEYHAAYYQKNRDRVLGQIREWYATHREEAAEKGKRYRKERWRRLAGWSKEEYAKRVASGCEICGRTDTKLVHDHCHDSDIVRGMLCDRCNRFLDWALEFQSEIAAYTVRAYKAVPRCA